MGAIDIYEPAGLNVMPFGFVKPASTKESEQFTNRVTGDLQISFSFAEDILTYMPAPSFGLVNISVFVVSELALYKESTFESVRAITVSSVVPLL